MKEVQTEVSLDYEKINLAISEMNGKYLTFLIDNQIFGISIVNVVQIIGMQEITEMPEFPNYAKGIINLRGSIIPAIDLRLRLGKIEKSYDERTCIIVTQLNESVIGLIVDSVDSVSDINEEDIASPPQVSNSRSNAYITGIAKYNKNVILIMDIEKILSDKLNEELYTN